MTQLLETTDHEATTAEKFAVIDTDNHPGLNMSDPVFRKYLPTRWQEYLDTIGLRFTGSLWSTPPQRSMTHRLDAVDDEGRTGWSVPLIRKQLLDEYDMSGALVTGLLGAQGGRGGQNIPDEMSVAIDRASNDAMREHYLEADPRFYGTINIPIEIPSEAVKEIQRIKESDVGDRYVEVMIEPGTDYALGNPKYWPIFEALEHYNLPLAVHVAGLHRRATGTGQHNFYFEAHVNFALRNYSIVPSMIFEGVFDRFPNLKMCLTEQSWAWAVPFAWRMDATHRVLRNEVSHLQRKPSDYLRENFYFHTQPLEEPEYAEDLEGVFEQFFEFGLGEHLMYSSDYPHWDFDSPFILPEWVSAEARRNILGANASRVYDIPLLPNSGISLPK
jgi:predicted TIM-barrel fold metal-dependent hydrolase